MPAGYAWSADDKQLLVSSDETGIFNVYALPAAGEGKQPLTSSTADSTFAVSWFPADGRVLFTADGGGNEINHLYVREADGKTRDLTPGDKAKAEFVGWSADKQHFFVTTNERDPQAFDLYRYAAKDYARTLVFKNDAALAALGRCRPTVAISRSSSRAPAPTPTSISLDLDARRSARRS